MSVALPARGAPRQAYAHDPTGNLTRIVDVTADPLNCGAIGAACVSGTLCCDGTCCGQIAPDGSFTLDQAGDVEVQLIFSKAAFRNYFLVVQPATTPATCTAGATTLNQCYFDTGPCAQCPQSTPTDFSCACVYNETTFLGNFPLGTPFRTQIQVDDGRDGTIDHIWYSDPTLNSDGFNHLHTFKVFDGTWILQWEDFPGGGDKDFNDLVAMVRVRPTNVPLGAIQLVAPSLSYLTNVVVEDKGVGIADGDRRVRLTTLLVNNSPTATTAAFCSSLNFSSSAAEPIENFTFADMDGAPDCNGSTTGDVTVRFSREQRTTNTCPHPAPLTGDQITVPAASAGQPGEVAFEYEMRLGDIDALVTNATNKLGLMTATQIRDRIANHATGMATDVFYNIQTSSLLCPSGPMSAYTGTIPPSVASTTSTANHPTTYTINSPVTVTVTTFSPETADPALPGVEAFLEYLWSDNLPVHLKGHINAARAPRTTFVAGGSGVRTVSVTLNFPNNLPEGFHGKLESVLRELATGRVLVTSTETFARDHTPPTLATFKTVRTGSSLAITGAVADLVSGLGQVRLSPTINGTAARPEYMHRVSGDFWTSTAMKASFGGLQQADTVAVDVTADDAARNASPTLRLPVANSGGDRTLECNSPTGADVDLDGSKSTFSGGVSLVWTGIFGSVFGFNPTVELPVGSSTISLQISDTRGFTGIQTSRITVEDSFPPVVSAFTATPACLWPPNHKYVAYKLGVNLLASAADVCDANPSMRIVRVESNEADNGQGDGDTAHDVIFGSSGLCVRSERSGKGKGRVYTVTLEAKDATGNRSEKGLTISVPHDQRDQSCAALPETAFVDDDDPQCVFPADVVPFGSQIVLGPLAEVLPPGHAGLVPPDSLERPKPRGCGCSTADFGGGLGALLAAALSRRQRRPSSGNKGPG